MLKTEILLYSELTELIYSKIAYCTVLVSKPTLIPQTRTRH